MAKNSMGIKTKKKILFSAGELFNLKGYDNVTVDEIAEGASITKAMVYYHFESKERIMLDLIQEFILEMKNYVQSKDYLINRSGNQDRAMEDILNIWKKNREIGIFILTKGIKDKQIFSELFQIIQMFYSGNFAPYQKKKEADSGDLFRLLFFNTIPLITYAVMSESLDQEKYISSEKADEVFSRAFLDNLNQIMNGNEYST